MSDELWNKACEQAGHPEFQTNKNAKKREKFWPTPNAHPSSKANAKSKKIGPGYPKWSPMPEETAQAWSKIMAIYIKLRKELE